MRYSVVAEDGRRLGVGEAGGGGEIEEGEEGGSSGGGGRDGGGILAVREFLSQRRGDPMLRMANQSIFADMLQVCVGRSALVYYTVSGRQYISSPLLLLFSTSTGCSCVLFGM